MGLTGADYRRQLQALLPRGAAWPRADGATLTRFLDGAAEEFARIGARVLVLFDEAVPASTSELLPDWERVAGLPDNCAGVLRTTVAERRLDLVSKLSSTGGQSRAYFIEVARVLGFEVDIHEFRPWRIGQNAIDEPLYNADWAHVWKILAPETEITYFEIGRSGINEPLRSWGNAALECRINQLKPAHTIVLFGYSELYLTSRPYVYVAEMDAVGMQGETTAVDLNQILLSTAVPTEAAELAAIAVAAELRQPLVSIDQGVEAADLTATAIAAELRPLLIGYETEDEAVSLSATAVAATLEVVLISNEMEPEAVSLSATALSGALT